MQQPALTLMIVDDHPLMRRGVRQLLALDPRLDVIAEANNGTEALAEARRQEPDIILLDLNMKGMSGLDTLKALRHEGISSRILVLTVSDARSDIFAMVDAGADGYLLKDSEPEILLGHILQNMSQQNLWLAVLEQIAVGTGIHHGKNITAGIGDGQHQDARADTFVAQRL